MTAKQREILERLADIQAELNAMDRKLKECSVIANRIAWELHERMLSPLNYMRTSGNGLPD